MISNNQDIIMHFDKGVDSCIRLAFQEFRKWLKDNISFPIKINVYITAEYRVFTKDNIKATGIFGTPGTKNKYPYIKLATGDFDELAIKIGYYNGMMCILQTFAHEITHYQQWVSDKDFTERLANKESLKLVNKYSDYKMGFLTENKKTINLIQKAYDYYDGDNYIQAIKYFNRLVLKCTDFGSIQIDLGDAYRSLNNYEQAIQCYNKEIDLNKKDYDLYVDKGYCLDKLHRFDEAVLCYNYAITLNPKDDYAYFNKGYSLFCLNKLLESISCFDIVIGINPEYEDAFIFKAQVMEELLRYDESIENYDKAIKINPNNIISYNGKGKILYTLGKYEESIEVINTGIQIEAISAEAYYFIALSYLALNQIGNCMINLRKSIEIDEEYKNIAKEEGFFNNINNLKSLLV